MVFTASDRSDLHDLFEDHKENNYELSEKTNDKSISGMVASDVNDSRGSCPVTYLSVDEGDRYFPRFRWRIFQIRSSLRDPYRHNLSFEVCWSKFGELGGRERDFLAGICTP